VLAAGAGTRLKPLTDLRPKALCPVNNRFLVDLAIDRARAVTPHVAVNVHHGRALMESHLRGKVHLSIEEGEALGTAGALGFLREWIGGRGVFLQNADAWHDTDIALLLLDAWDEDRPRLLVVRDEERPDFDRRWRYAGAAVLPWWAVRELEPEPSGLWEVSWRRLREHGMLDLIRLDAPFFDCGTPADYLAANLVASGGESVIGPGATVEGEVVRSVVWPGAVVHEGERLVHAIRATHDMTVQVPSS
jgi:NDP-sugar pyrophosphorylase family protein